jgi:signal transduction histidine kinase/ActR/RegA family two-component response regulator
MCKNRTKKLLFIAFLVGITVMNTVIQPVSVHAEGKENSAVSENQSEKRVVRVGYFDGENSFFSGNSDDAPKSGYAYEYMQLLSNYNNWEYEYVYGTWGDLFNKLLNGEIDMMPDISYTKERAEKLYYSDQSMGEEDYYIFINSDQDSGISEDDYSTFDGKRIGVDEDSAPKDFLISWMAEHNISAEIVEYDGETKRQADFESGKIDAHVTLDAYEQSNWQAIEKIGSSDYYFAVSKNQPEVIKELNQAQSTILEENCYFNETLQDKYFTRSAVKKTLDDTEKSWISKHSTLRVGYLENYLPYCATDDENGQMKGALTLFLNNIAKEYGVKFSYLAYNSSVALKDALENGEIDIMFPIRGSLWVAEGEKYMLSNPLFSTGNVLLYSGDYSEENIKQIAAISSRAMSEKYLTEQYPNAEIVWYKNMNKCLKDVSENEGIGILMDSCALTDFMKQYPKAAYLQVAFLSSITEIRLAVRENETTLLKILNKGIGLTEEDDVNNTLIRYSQFESTYTFRDFLRDNVERVIAIAILVITLLTMFFMILIKNRIQLIHATEAAKEAQERAEAANRAKSVFINNMSHDIRTPMNAVIGFTTLAANHIDDPKRVEDYLKKIETSSNHLLSLINAILDMSRIESSQMQLEHKGCHLPTIMRTLVTVIMGQAEAKRIHLHIDMDEIQNETVYCDPLRLDQVLVNLLGNAIKFTKEDGNIWISVKEIEVCELNQSVYEFRVKDDGIGMSEEFQKHVFEQFSRERTSTVSGIPGTGLGMSISKSIVDMMGGTIEVFSKEGKGTEFVVTLQLELHEEMELVSSHELEETDIISGKRILLVEDNELNREIAMTILEEEGFEIETAQDGQMAVDMVRKSESDYYDVILMDIQMPVMDGYEATRTIRQMEGNYHANIPIIAMTANAFVEDKEKAISVGMNGYVPKPIDISKLLETLNHIFTKNDTEEVFC